MIHYVPILKGKRGELTALARLLPDVRSRMKPLFELPFGKRDQSIDLRLHTFVTSLGKRLPVGQPAFVDFYPLSDDAATTNGLNAIVTGFALIAATPFLGL